MFQKAQRFLTNPTIAITGPTGSGKTYSALRLATGIAKAMNTKIAFIDTENGSASLYSDTFDFDTMSITPPFTTEKYIDAINAAEKKGYGVLVCDSITHAWAGEGGLLEQKAQLDARPGSNHWTNWNPIKIKDQKFKNAYLHSSIPFFIATMRSKMEYAQTENNGKKKVEKQGMAPVQSDGIEYEFSLVFDCAMNHEAEVSKDRTHLFANKKIFQITEETGADLVAWRNSGKAKPVSAPPPPQPEDESQQFPEDVIDHAHKQALDKGYVDNQSLAEGPDELSDFLGPAAPSWEQAQEYKATFGKFKGKPLRMFKPAEVKSYLKYLFDESVKTNKKIDPNGPVGIFMLHANVYLGVD